MWMSAHQNLTAAFALLMSSFLPMDQHLMSWKPPWMSALHIDSQQHIMDPNWVTSSTQLMEHLAVIHVTGCSTTKSLAVPIPFSQKLVSPITIYLRMATLSSCDMSHSYTILKKTPSTMRLRFSCMLSF